MNPGNITLMIIPPSWGPPFRSYTEWSHVLRKAFICTEAARLKSSQLCCCIFYELQEAVSPALVAAVQTTTPYPDQTSQEDSKRNGVKQQVIQSFILYSQLFVDLPTVLFKVGLWWHCFNRSCLHSWLLIIWCGIIVIVGLTLIC